MKFSAVKGMHDVVPAEASMWEWIEREARALFATYGFEEIRTPVLEKTALFVRGVGATSAIVEKEMYTFVDQGGEELTLRPEGTAPVVRAYVEQGLYQDDQASKLFYIGPMFRHERPQKGRFRQFSQIGVELLGAAHPLADAEVIAMAVRLVARLGIDDTRLEVNSLGCENCRPNYQAALGALIAQVASQLCDDCHRRIEKNPQRIFDCKNTTCQQALADAPIMQDYWCEPCHEHFSQVCAGLEAMDVPYYCNHRIVRGLDYYQRTAFEIVTNHLGAQSALCGGGRYDGLVKELGGPDSPGVGFALGLERLVMLLEEAQRRPVSRIPRVYVAALGQAAREQMLPVMQQLRQQGVRVEWDYEDRSLKSQMRRADRCGAQWVVIAGDQEIAAGTVAVRNMTDKSQHDIALGQLVTKVSELISLAKETA